MAIDWENERVIPLSDVPRYVQSRAPGKRLSKSTAWRWAMKNQLETFATPGGRFTSLEALGRFFDRCSAARGTGAGSGSNSCAAPRPATAGPSTQAVLAGEQLRQLIGGDVQDRQ